VLISPLTPEFRLLIACSWLPPASKPGEVAELCAAGIDWTEFLALVRRHQVPSLASKILRGEQIPGEVRRELKALSSSACAAALHAAGELARLSRAFAQADVAMMPLKGVMLSIQLFGDPATRHPGDLDLMVQPEDFTRAGELLLSLGYRCKLTRPMQQLLRMGRGAVIPLDAKASDEVWILANNHPVARGEIQISDEKISIAVTRAANVYDYMAGGT